MSDTPRTYALEKRYARDPYVGIYTVFDHACQLERENAALRADKERLVALLETWYDMAQSCHLEQQEVGFADHQISAGMMVDTKEAIDAARKEQP